MVEDSFYRTTVLLVFPVIDYLMLVVYPFGSPNILGLIVSLLG